jgi:hypothetical protein
MVNENHFQFNCKNLFNFWKRFTVFKTLNRFLDLNSSFLQARLLESVTARHWSLLVVWIYYRRFSNFGIWSPESGDFRPPLSDSDDQIPPKLVEIGQFTMPDSSHLRWNSVNPDSGKTYETCPLPLDFGLHRQNFASQWQNLATSGFSYETNKA